jgi:hypothetical protein
MQQLINAASKLTPLLPPLDEKNLPNDGKTLHNGDSHRRHVARTQPHSDRKLQRKDDTRDHADQS